MLAFGYKAKGICHAKIDSMLNKSVNDDALQPVIVHFLR